MEIYKNLDLQDLENEIWKDIDEFEDYQISNLGRIKSYKRYIEGKILKPYKNNCGYFCIVLCKNGKCKNKKIHILIFETFIEKIPEGYVIHHKDGNKENNSLDNLQLMNNSDHIILHMKGKIVSEETKKLMSEKMSGKYFGENSPMFGKHHSEKSKKLMSENHNSKLKENQVKIIYQISNSPITKQLKITQKEIGEIFGVSPSVISRIKNNKTWKY